LIIRVFCNRCFDVDENGPVIATYAAVVVCVRRILGCIYLCITKNNTETTAIGVVSLLLMSLRVSTA